MELPLLLQEGAQDGSSVIGWFSGTPWIDLVGLGIVVLFFGLGIKHGLVWQVTRLIGMLIAVAVARSVAPDLTPRVQASLELSERACMGIVWVLVFFVCLLVAAGIGMIGKRALEAVQLGPMDRMGGALAGAMTGLVVHSALMVLLMSLGTHDWASRTFDGSRSAVVLDNLARKTNILLNAQAAERIVGPWGEEYDRERGRQMRQEAREVERGNHLVR